MLVGTSRKSFIRSLTSDSEQEARNWGTAATVVVAIMNGAHIVRVHDVRQTRVLADVTDRLSTVKQCSISISIPHLTWNAALDILIVAFLIYQLLVFIKGTRAVQMALGLGLVIAFFYFSRWVRLETVTWMLTNMLPYFVFAIIVIFQHEIRRALARFGQAPLIRRVLQHQSK